MHFPIPRTPHILIPLAGLALVLSVSGDPPNRPTWWTDGISPVITTAATENNQGPANIGQAKHMVSEALRALENVDPAGAGKVRDKLTLPQWNPVGGVLPPVLDLTIPAVSSPGWIGMQKAPLLIGQLKAISGPFYSAMNVRQPAWLEGQLVVNLTKDQGNANNPYPWTSGTADDSNRATATIGQLKAVFSLRFEHLAAQWDRDGDGLSNAEEAHIGSNPDRADTDGDGLSDGEEIRLATDPIDAASDGIPNSWELAHGGTFALYAPTTSATLEKNQTSSVPLLLSNDTTSPISYTLSVASNTTGVVAYGARDSVSGGVNYEWEEISGTGTRLATVSDSDDVSEMVNISGFAFPFEETNYTHVEVGSNGILTFEANGNPTTNDALPTNGQSGDFIAAFWDDLNPATGGDVYWKQNTDRLIIQYEGVARYSGPGNYTFQVVLYSDGRIQVRYKSLTGQTNSCTVGVQNSAGIAVQAAYNQPYLAAGMSIEFGVVPAEFFSVSKLSGTVPPHGVGVAWGQFRSMNLATGSYQASLTVTPGGGLAPIVIGPILTVVDILDADNDTLPDAWEIANGYNPNDTYDRYLDEDGDLLTLGFEYAQGTSDKVGNMDFDGDGWNDYWEFQSGTNPHNPDTDGDSVGDFAEDLDHDGLSNSAEINIHHTHSLFADTDHDGIKDGVEVAMGLDPKNGEDGQTDLDADGLTLAEELGMGTDPANPDSDGDGLWDGLEVDLGLDPLDPESYRPGTSDGDADLDGDGLSNLQEVALGTNPKKKDTDGDGFPDNVDVDPLDPNVGAPGTGGGNPPAPVVVKTWAIERTINPYDFDEYNSSGGHGGSGAGKGVGKITYTADWYDPDASNTYNLKSPIPYPSLDGKLARYAPFINDHTRGQVLEIVIAEARSRTIPNPPCYHATMDHNRVWIVADRPPSTPIEMAFVRVEERTKDGVQLPKKIVIKKLTIAPGRTKSAPYDIITKLEETGSAGNVAHSETTKVSFLPIEIVDKAKSPITELRVGKMENALTAAGVLDIDQDDDRFFVRIRGAGFLGNIKVRLATVENPDVAYNDGADLIVTTADGDDLVTKSLLLVADDIDDIYAGNGVGADDVDNDRTHKVQLGGKVQIVGLEINGDSFVADAKTIVPVKFTVDLNVKILKVGGTGVVTEPSVESDLKIAKERYAQVAVLLNWSIATVDPPTGVDLSDGLKVASATAPTYTKVAAETKSLIAGLGTAGTNSDIFCYYVNSIDAFGSLTSRGVALADYWFDESEENYTNEFVVAAAHTPFTLPHELGHLVTDDGHHADTINLMKDGTSTINTLSASKRYDKAQEGRIWSSKLVKLKK